VMVGYRKTLFFFILRRIFDVLRHIFYALRRIFYIARRTLAPPFPPSRHGVSFSTPHLQAAARHPKSSMESRLLCHGLNLGLLMKDAGRCKAALLPCM
jgi:hypothetical protein